MVKQLLQFIVSKIVDKPESVVISEIEISGKNVIEIRVASQDLAKVIGKEGRTFKAMRGLIYSIEPNSNKDLVVDVII